MNKNTSSLIYVYEYESLEQIFNSVVLKSQIEWKHKFNNLHSQNLNRWKSYEQNVKTEWIGKFIL